MWEKMKIIWKVIKRVGEDDETIVRVFDYVMEDNSIQCLMSQLAISRSEYNEKAKEYIKLKDMFIDVLEKEALKCKAEKENKDPGETHRVSELRITEDSTKEHISDKENKDPGETHQVFELRITEDITEEERKAMKRKAELEDDINETIKKIKYVVETSDAFDLNAKSEMID